MKKSFFLGVILFLAGVIGIRAQTNLVVRIHFAGVEKISADTNSPAFTNEFCSPAALALESQTLDKLSRAPAAWLKYGMPSGVGDGTAQLRPLLDDFLKSEWLFEMRDVNNLSPEYALAIRLSDERAQLWQKNLQSLLESWTKISAQKIPDGFELQKHQPPNLFRFQRHGDWVVLDCGENELPLGGEILELFLNLRPHANESFWLTADLNWPRLAQLFPAFSKFDFSKTELHVNGRDGNFWLNGKFNFAQPLSPLGKWQLPTNTIRQPLDSFTAVRGFAPWLAKQNWARRFELSTPPDQWFIWSLAQIPFQTFVAVPVPDANAALAQLDARLPKSSSMSAAPQNAFLSTLTTAATNNEIIWRGVPFISPFVQALHEPAGDFLFGGFFPNSPPPQPLPPELLAVFDHPNLVYYHWEITAERLKLQLQLLQLSLLLTQHRQLAAESAAGQWLKLIGPKLGITVTEITQTAPAELTFERSAPGGLTALEFFALANWLEAPDFPGCDLSLTTDAETFKRPPAQTSGATSAPPVVSH
jgi:hypothetical protein